MSGSAALFAPDRLDALLPRLRALRRDLHRHPELGFEERRTQALVRAWLEEQGYAPSDCAGTGLVADLRPGVPGPTIALRADLDALPIQEELDVPHRSVHEGVAHKCGHDGHTSILLGVAALLAAARGALPDGTNVRLLFQPAEEGVRGGGARVMLAEGALDGVREVYGLHNWPGFPKGEIRVAAGPVMAREYQFRIGLEGRGGHASEPETTRDPVTAGAQMVLGLNAIPARGLGHRGGAVLSVTSFQAGRATNVIPSRAVLLGTVRTFDEALGERIVGRIREVVAGTAQAMGVRAELELRPGFPVLVNDPACVEVVRAAATAVVGAARVSAAGLPLAASEDFAYLAQAVPAAYFFIGAGIDGADTPGCHHPDYDFDDDLLAPAIATLLGIVERRLGAV
jgi:amidohydrolase